MLKLHQQKSALADAKKFATANAARKKIVDAAVNANATNNIVHARIATVSAQSAKNNTNYSEKSILNAIVKNKYRLPVERK